MRSHARPAAASLAVAGIVLGIFGVAPAGAHPSPPGCQSTASNSLSLDIARDRAILRNGDVINYTVTAANNSVGAGTICDVTGATVILQLPGPDGNPGGSVVSVPVPNNGDFPAGTGSTVLGTFPWTVSLYPGVTNARVSARAVGTLHDIEGDDIADITKTLGTTVVPPTLTLTHTVTPGTGDAPLGVTHNYTLTHDSGTGTSVSNPTISDSSCVGATPTGGDTNGNHQIDVGETWTFTCSETLATPGTITTTATGGGTLNTGFTITSPAVPATVTVTAPPATPQQGGSPEPGPGTDNGDSDAGGGQNGGPSQPTRREILRRPLPAVTSPSARRPASCVSVPASLRVRALERTTVRVRVTRAGGRPARRALVRIVGPGISVRLITGSKGIATVTLRPRRGGTLVIQSDRCLGADRVTVLGARRTDSGRVPRVTG